MVISRVRVLGKGPHVFLGVLLSRAFQKLLHGDPKTMLAISQKVAQKMSKVAFCYEVAQK